MNIRINSSVAQVGAPLPGRPMIVDKDISNAGPPILEDIVVIDV